MIMNGSKPTGGRVSDKDCLREKPDFSNPTAMPQKSRETVTRIQKMIQSDPELVAKMLEHFMKGDG